MNFEFPIQELPAVMRGPRIERRRVLIGGSAFWVTMVDAGKLRLDDGRVLDADNADYLPPVSPSKIIAVHISYSSRSHETRNKPKPTESRPISPSHQPRSTATAGRSSSRPTASTSTTRASTRW